LRKTAAMLRESEDAFFSRVSAQRENQKMRKPQDRIVE
jgi:hypothetical protein